MWCDEELKFTKNIRKAEKVRCFKVEIDCIDLSMIRSIESKCLIFTKVELLWDLDYKLSKKKRSVNDWIDLLVVRSFSTYRTVEKSLSRVCHYNKTVTRYKLEHVDLIDKKVVIEFQVQLKRGTKLLELKRSSTSTAQTGLSATFSWFLSRLLEMGFLCAGHKLQTQACNSLS